MPNCIIEYSKPVTDSVSVSELINTVHGGALDSALFDENHIKTRASGFEDYRVGDGDMDFVHVTLKILSGRSPDQKRHLSDLVLARLQGLGLTSTSITVDVVDMQRDCYGKYLD